MPEENSTADDDPGSDLGLVDSLVQLSFLIQSVLTRVGAAHDLPLGQLRLLGIVRDREIGMMELAAHLGLDKSSVTGLIDRAEKRSLVKRSRVPGDGRAFRVSITAAGLELAEVGATAVRDEIATLTQGLSIHQRSQLSAMVSTVVSTGRNLSTDRRPGPRS